MKKHLVSLICFCIVLILSGVCYGKETYPLGVLTKEQSIEKYFSGRTLDLIEGVWDYEPDEYFFIVNIDALKDQKEKYPDIDFLMIEGTSKVNHATIVHKLKKNTITVYLSRRQSIFHNTLAYIHG